MCLAADHNAQSHVTTTTVHVSHVPRRWVGESAGRSPPGKQGGLGGRRPPNVKERLHHPVNLPVVNTIVHACSMVIVHACTMYHGHIVHVCIMTTVHACMYLAVVNACIMVAVHAYIRYMHVLWLKHSSILHKSIKTSTHPPSVNARMVCVLATELSTSD